MSSPSLDTGAIRSRACGNCARAKAKCETQINDMSTQQCARCFRLKKECIVQPRAKRKKRTPNAVGTAELESKIESLVNLLSAAQASKLEHGEDHGESGNPGINLSRDFSLSKANNGFAGQRRLPQPNSVGTDLSSSTRVTAPPTTSPLYYTPAKAASTKNSTIPPIKAPEELLQIFRVQFTVLFPYAIISPNITAAELCEKQPWLYRMVMMATSSHERHRQIETGKLIISNLSTALLTGEEKSLDMLRALLVYASWSHYYAAVLPQFQSSGVLQLVLALIYDLGLNRAARFDRETAAVLADAEKRISSEERTNPREAERSLDECRALLYAFYLSSTFSTCARKADGLQSSPYIDYSCKVLLESAECEADLILVACVRFQSIADSVHRALPSRLAYSDGRNAPLWMHTDHLQNELQTLFNNLSPDLQNQAIVRLSYHSVQMFLNDAAIMETWNIPTFNSRRIDLRWSCLMAGKAVLDTFLTLPPSVYHVVPIPNLAQLGFCLINLFKLAFVEDQGWDLVHVRETANFTSYIDHFASQLERLGASIDSAQNPPAEESFPTTCARAMTWVKGFYDAKVASASEVGRVPGQQYTGMIESSYDMLNQYTVDYMDEPYWQELMADFSHIPMQQFSSKDAI